MPAAQAHVDAIHFAGAIRKTAQREEQAAPIEAYRRESARERTRALDRVIDEHHDFIGVGRQRRVGLLDLAGEASQHERNTGKFLAEAVVQIAADTLLLAIRDFDDLVLEPLALRDVLHDSEPHALTTELEARHDRLAGEELPSLAAAGENRA